MNYPIYYNTDNTPGKFVIQATHHQTKQRKYICTGPQVDTNEYDLQMYDSLEVAAGQPFPSMEAATGVLLMEPFSNTKNIDYEVIDIGGN